MWKFKGDFQLEDGQTNGRTNRVKQGFYRAASLQLKTYILLLLYLKNIHNSCHTSKTVQIRLKLSWILTLINSQYTYKEFLKVERLYTNILVAIAIRSKESLFLTDNTLVTKILSSLNLSEHAKFLRKIDLKLKFSYLLLYVVDWTDTSFSFWTFPDSEWEAEQAASERV